MKQQILHWLLAASGFLAAICGLAGYAHLIPGRIGQVLVSLFIFLAAVERVLLLVEDVMEGKRSADSAAGEMVRDVEVVGKDVQALGKAAEPFIKKGN